jgi:uncharacterized protein YgbK (DUF1537 family)
VTFGSAAAAGSRPERRVVVFDDDPTGTQTVSAVDIILDGSAASIEAAFRSSPGPLYLLTNSRSVPEAEAVALVREMRARVESVAGRRGEPFVIVLRGDSTLRGHVFAEVDAIADPDAVVLFVPAFLEGGRTTVGGEHRLRIDGVDRNVADTEFARDATFGFRSRTLVDWVAEVGRGRRARMVPLHELRASAGGALTTALLDAGPGEVVIPEVAEAGDVDAALHGLWAAEATGRHVLVRAASTFAAAVAGLVPRSIERVDLGPAARVLVACGSHTDASSRQLAALAREGRPTHLVTPHDGVPSVIDAVGRSLDEGGAAVVATPRRFVEGTDLAGGQAYLDALVPVVVAVAPDVDAVVAKGGITSARIPRALGAGVARVEGQLQPGVALWTLDLPDRDGGLPYVVVPGNVGRPETLSDILGQLGVTPVKGDA